jgi:hypothetical protein
MLSYSIALGAAVSTTARINTAYLISTTKEFTENTCNSMTSSTTHYQEQLQGITIGDKGVRSK